MNKNLATDDLIDLVDTPRDTPPSSTARSYATGLGWGAAAASWSASRTSAGGHPRGRPGDGAQRPPRGRDLAAAGRPCPVLPGVHAERWPEGPTLPQLADSRVARRRAFRRRQPHGDFAPAVHGPNKNFQLPIRVLKTLCLLTVWHCGVWLPCGNYRDNEAELRCTPGLVVADATGHRLAPLNWEGPKAPDGATDASLVE